MIEIRIAETGKKDGKGFENECRVLVKGSGKIIEPQLVSMCEILEKELGDVFTHALELWLEKSILDEIAGGDDDD